MKKSGKRTLALVLTLVAMVALMCVSASAAENKAAPEDSEIVSIQATTAPNFYGHKVSDVKVTYKEGTDLSGVSLEDYVIYDRGFNDPNFGPLELTDCTVEGNVVTLSVDAGSDKVEDRTRESYGLLCSSSNWYVDSEGVIHFGEEASTDALGTQFQPNTIKKGLQWRGLDLIFCSNGKAIEDGIRSSDGAGNPLTDSVWAETILGGGLDEVEKVMVDIGEPAPGYTMQGDNGEIPTFIIYPEGYDPNRAEPYPVIDYQCGGGVCYWEVTDGSTTSANNLGCNVVYDTMMTEWHKLMPDAIIVSVDVHSPDVALSASEIIGVMNYGVENWNFDADRILLVGNSQGTLISSEVIRQAPQLVAGYVECNGNLGGMAAAADVDGTLEHSSLGGWDVAEVQAMIDNSVAVWMFNGETDGDNPAAQQDVIEIVKDLYRQAGKSEDWISLHVRASGLQSWKFKEWGETDHSVTKVVAWNYLARPYNDPWQDRPALAVGDTFTYSGLEEDEAYKDKAKIMDYEYTVYPESVSQWAQAVFDTVEETAPADPSQTLADQGLLEAIPDSALAPDVNTIRGQVITFLYNLADRPEGAAPAFADVAQDAWYAKAIGWAAQSGIISGYGNSNCGPEDLLPREQLATMLYRYSQFKGLTGTQADLSSFPDAASISPYAVDAMRWAVGEGILSAGEDGTLAPGANVTWGQAASILVSFCEKMG